jgi:uncharacterized membrane protein
VVAIVHAPSYLELAMLPNPLHPAVVHFPIVFMMLLPLAALGALWAIRRGSTVTRAWAFPVAAAAALAASAWASLETGEGDEERAEDVVGEQALNTHEAAAERFLLLAGGVLVITAAGLLRGNVGRAGRALGTIAALGLIIAGYQVGHSGGRLVYGDGARPGLSGIVSDQAGTGERDPAVGDNTRERDD